MCNQIIFLFFPYLFLVGELEGKQVFSSSDPHRMTFCLNIFSDILSGIHILSHIFSDILALYLVYLRRSLWLRSGGGACGAGPVGNTLIRSWRRSGGEHSDPELAVEVRRGTLWSWAWRSGGEHSDPELGSPAEEEEAGYHKTWQPSPDRRGVTGDSLENLIPFTYSDPTILSRWRFSCSLLYLVGQIISFCQQNAQPRAA